MFKDLVESFEKIGRSEFKRNETLFDICGFPHYETVTSNILAFFFLHSNPHGLGKLFTVSLLEALKIPCKGLDLQFQVDREVRTDDGGFIDILLYNDSLTIVVENKIYAGLNNDLSDYFKHAQKKGALKTIGIVLSIDQINIPIPEFTNLTYAVFLNKIKDNLGHFVGNKASNYLSLLLDFIENISSISKGKTQMNSNFVNFIRDNHDKVFEFGAELKKFHDDLRSIVKTVNSEVVDLLKDQSVNQWPWRNLPELLDVAVSDFELKNGICIAINSEINPNNWEFKIFVRKNPGIDFNLFEYCRSKGLVGEVVSEDRFFLKEKISVENTTTEVARKIVQIIGSLKS